MTSTQAVRAMITNPGGVVDAADLIGRARELHRLLASVDTGGAKLLGDRRMGKTSLLRALSTSLDEVGHTVIRLSGESSDPEKFGS
jgi:AAA+ ATPase superfamily predicted ATPase